MRRFLSLITTPAGLLYLYVLITEFIRGLYLARGTETPPLYTLLYPFVFLWIIGWWLQQDSPRHNFKRVCDMGLFLYIAWPFIIPYYLFKTRGTKAFLTILSFIAVYIGAFAIGVIAYTVGNSLVR